MAAYSPKEKDVVPSNLFLPEGFFEAHFFDPASSGSEGGLQISIGSAASAKATARLSAESVANRPVGGTERTLDELWGRSAFLSVAETTPEEKARADECAVPKRLVGGCKAFMCRASTDSGTSTSAMRPRWRLKEGADSVRSPTSVEDCCSRAD